jgi:CRISPR-associated protein Cas5d
MKIRLWGERALFAIPAYKVEARSYPIPPPTAIEGLLRNLYWHPGFEWRLNRIAVNCPIVYESVTRNMVQDIAPSQETLAAGKRYTIEDDRTQRTLSLLRNVDYTIDCALWHPEPIEQSRGNRITIERLQRGQHWAQPYLGQREFTAHLALLPPDTKLRGHPTLGREMLLPVMPRAIRFTPKGTTVEWFQPTLRDGVLDLRNSERQESSDATGT